MKKLGHFMRDYPGVLITILVVIIGTIMSPKFLTASNLVDVLQLAAERGLLAAGMTLVLLSGGGGVDLSVGANFAFAMMVVAMTQAYAGLPTIVSIILGVLAGLFIGMLNGILVTKAKLQPFVATLVMMMNARALALLINSGKPVSTGVPQSFNVVVSTKIGILALPAILWLAAIIIVHFVITSTKYGRNLTAIGGNEEAAAYTGISVNVHRFWAYAICGALVGLASSIGVARQMIGEPRGGSGYEMLAIAACVMGGVSMNGGKGNGVATLFGVLAIGVINNMMNIAAVNMHLQTVVQGVIVFASVLVPMLTEKLADLSEKKAAVAAHERH